jgi:transposase
MDNALSVAHNPTASTSVSGDFVQLFDTETRAQRQRRCWIKAYQTLGDAGAVCRRFAVSRPTIRKRLRRYEQQGEAGLKERSRRPHSSPARNVGETQEALILGLRRERRLGVKRLRNEGSVRSCV